MHRSNGGNNNSDSFIIWIWRPSDAAYISSFKTWNPGHEYLPIYQGIIDANPNMTGNSANNNIANTPAFAVHPVVNLD